jgi:hypothetical protein
MPPSRHPGGGFPLAESAAEDVRLARGAVCQKTGLAVRLKSDGTLAKSLGTGSHWLISDCVKVKTGGLDFVNC